MLLRSLLEMRNLLNCYGSAKFPMRGTCQLRVPQTRSRGWELGPGYGWESGRRLSVGRSSSVEFGSLPVGCFLDCSVLLRKVGLSFASVTLRANIIPRNRPFT